LLDLPFLLYHIYRYSRVQRPLVLIEMNLRKHLHVKQLITGQDI